MKINNFLDIFKLKGRQRKNIEMNKAVYDNMVDVSDVADGYEYFKAFLFEKLIKIFKYENLPPTIPAQALEDYILHFGNVGVVNDSKYGLVAVPINKYGVGLYPRFEPYAIYATPLVEGSGTIGDDVAVIKNNAYEISCKQIVERYARMLADAESTISNVLYNMRLPMIPAFDDDESAESYKALMVANRLGQTDAVINSSFLSNMQMFPTGATSSNHTINDLLTARADILRMFLAEIGVQTANEKRERMTTEEVNANSQMLLFNIRDMYDSRRDGVEMINRLYGTNITVSLSDEYTFLNSADIEEKGVENE